ncbi:hypothetical protein ABW21_db0207741 [Orbilia brochopaga]|nr:hypothetical protein ABW21_db0207741 [Drechslerella brochopaga]
MAMPIQLGDVIALANMCYAIAQAFGSGRKAAPVEFREVQNELYGLGQMLDLLKNSVESGAITTSSMVPAPTSQASQCIARMVANCQNTVDSLKDFAVKYAPLAGLEFVEEKSGVTVKRAPSTSKQKLKRNWKRLMWTTEVSTIQGIRDQISIHVQSITAVVSLVNTHTTIDLRKDVRSLQWQGEAHRLEIQAARADIYNVNMGVSMAEANIHHHVSSDIQMVRQDIQTLNHRLETIMAWQQRDMTSDVFNQQISQLLIKIEQLERLPHFAQPAAGPTLPYPTNDGMPIPYAAAAQLDFYASSNASSPNFSGHRRTSSRSRTDPVGTFTQYSAAVALSVEPQELPTRRPTRRMRSASFSNESMPELESIHQQVHLQVSVVNQTPVEIGLSSTSVDLQSLPPRGSRETSTDV